ncbi:hypothetical protein ACIPPM_22395 [Streptomyces sp. NPDC090119]|uniref:hypothetical protein n=1 Tax=Streptomyces sp. NPDC090119 TaxID=3365951 RepID=UPI00383089B6
MHIDSTPGIDLAGLLTPDGNLAPSWLSGKSVTPLAVGERLGEILADRVTAGCRSTGATHLRYASLGAGAPVVTTRAVPADAATRPPTLLWTPDRQGALLFPAPGHALLAGTRPFMTAAVPEGTDEARARFTRYARRQSARHPELLTPAAEYAPAHHAWAHPEDVTPNTTTAQHLYLLQEFTEGTLPAPAFARAWWQTRRTAQANGERVRGPLEELLDRVFMLLEDYEVEPHLAEPGDLSDVELRRAIAELWQQRGGPGPPPWNPAP